MTDTDSPAIESPTIYRVLRETWLTRKPDAAASFVAATATLVVAIASLFYEFDLAHARDWMAASGDQVFAKHQYWRLFTTMLAHADAGHLLSNSFLFFILSYFLYGYFGFGLFPAAAVLGGALANLVVLPSYSPETILLGASGVVYWMGGAWLVLYFALSRQKNLAQRWIRTLGVAILLFMPAESFEPSVSYRTHLAGFAIGVLSGTWTYYARRDLYRSAEIYEVVVEPLENPENLEPPEPPAGPPGSNYSST